MRILPALIALLFGGLMLCGPARADIERGIRAMDRGDYAMARTEFEASRRHGDPSGDFYLGYLADHGLGMAPDPALAAGHYRRAAEAGLPAAQSNLGNLYDNGRGVPRDGAVAERLYSLAASGGSITAKNNLAYLWARQGLFLEEALCLSAETLRAEPERPHYRDTYGFVLLRLERLDEAETWFNKALAVEPNYGVAVEHLGDVAAARGQTGRAADLWRRARPLARFPADAQRIDRKLSGATDLDQHAPYDAKNDGFGRHCAAPTV